MTERDDAPAPPAPGTVRVACVLVYLGAVASLVGWSVLAGWYVLTTEPPEARASVVAVNLDVLAIVAAANVPPCVLAVLTRRGHHAARIGLTVVGGLYTIVGLTTLFGGGTLAALLTPYVGLWTVLPWLGGANDWYRNRRAARVR